MIIIGGGIAGCSAAYFLTQTGHTVTLIEKDSIAAHASGYAFGVLLPRLMDDRSNPVDALTGHSLDLHRQIATELAAEGEDLRRQKASVLLALNETDAEQYRSLYRSGSSFIGDVRWLEYGELSHIEPRISPKIPGGVYLGDSAEISPDQYTNALWRAAERRGSNLVSAEVESVSSTGSQSVTVQADGQEYSAGRVIVAAGPWSARLLENVGMAVPVEPLKGQIVRLKAPGPEMRVSLWWGGDYAGSKPDGLLWCGTTEERVGFDEKPTDNARYGILSSANGVLPFLKNAEVVQQTACLRPVTVDGLPLIGSIPGDDSIIVATGGGRNGIVLGPALGRVAADLAGSREPEVDVSFLGPSRFAV